MNEPLEPRPVLFPPVISFLLIANALVFILQLFAFEPLLVNFALWPVGTPDVIEQNGETVWVPQFQIWQLVSYGFLHGGLLHLFLNLFAMWMLGVQLENAWGSRLFAIYFFVCVVGAGLIQLAVASHGVLNAEIYPTIGASGLAGPSAAAGLDDQLGHRAVAFGNDEFLARGEPTDQLRQAGLRFFHRDRSHGSVFPSALPLLTGSFFYGITRGGSACGSVRWVDGWMGSGGPCR